MVSPGLGFRLSAILFLTIGSLFVMWIGEQINAHGLGNGSSMIIFAGIVRCNQRFAFIIVIYINQHCERIIFVPSTQCIRKVIFSKAVFIRSAERAVKKNLTSWFRVCCKQIFVGNFKKRYSLQYEISILTGRSRISKWKVQRWPAVLLQLKQMLFRGLY